jgi:hypothetical protein
MDFKNADKVQEYNLDGKLQGILVVNGNERTCIPLVADNTDYQAYLKWVAEGGVPTPADEVTL